MGMHAHVVAVQGDAPSAMSGWSDDEIAALLHGDDAEHLDKSWEAAFPLIGSIAGTGMMLVDDSLPIGHDLGVGPARFIDPDRVAAMSALLAAADDATVEEHWAALDSPFMANGLYDDEDGKEFAMYGYRTTAAVLADAAASGRGVLFAIT